MSCIECSRINEVVEQLDGILERVEQQAQEIRWRIANFPGDVPAHDDEIAGLTEEAFRVAVLYGQLSVLVAADGQEEKLEPACEVCGDLSSNLCDGCLGHFCDDCSNVIDAITYCEECYQEEFSAA